MKFAMNSLELITEPAEAFIYLHNPRIQYHDIELGVTGYGIKRGLQPPADGNSKNGATEIHPIRVRAKSSMGISTAGGGAAHWAKQPGYYSTIKVGKPMTVNSTWEAKAVHDSRIYSATASGVSFRPGTLLTILCY
jgi:hypothetical protein